LSECVEGGEVMRMSFCGRLLQDWSGQGCEERVGWQVCTLRGHTSGVTSVAISQDGKWVVSGARDHLVKICNAETGAEVSSCMVRCGWGYLFVGGLLANGFEGGLM
jgi:WD40 repeat protein